MPSEHFVHLVAGSMSGLIEHVVTFPLDTIKTRLQSLTFAAAALSTSTDADVERKPRSTTALACTRASSHRNFQAVIASSNLRNIYSGVSASLISAPIAHGLHFAVYEATQSYLQPVASTVAASFCVDDRPTSHPSSFLATTAQFAPTAATIVSSIGAAAAHDFVSTPFDVIKQRMQVLRYSSMSQAFLGTIATDGPAILLRAFPVTVTMNVPHSAAHWVTYEAVCKALRGFFNIEVHEEPTWQYFLAGGMAGACGAICSNPLDVIKTRIQLSELADVELARRAGIGTAQGEMQVHGGHGHSHGGVLSVGGSRASRRYAKLVARDILKADGIKGLYRGPKCAEFIRR